MKQFKEAIEQHLRDGEITQERADHLLEGIDIINDIELGK